MKTGGGIFIITMIAALAFSVVTAEAQSKKRRRIVAPQAVQNVVQQLITSPADGSYITDPKLQCPAVPVGAARIYQAELFVQSNTNKLKLLADGPPTPPDAPQQCRFEVVLSCEFCSFDQFTEVRTGDAPGNEFIAAIGGSGLSVVSISCAVPSATQNEPFILSFGQTSPDPMERVELLPGSWLICF